MSLLHEAIVAGVAQALRGLYVGMPGRLEDYDHKSGRGTVKPLIQEPDINGDLQSLKPIVGVPVIMLGGSKSALYLPPATGDTGWIAFSHRSIENWLDRGGDATPGDPRVMDMTDAVFWPGLQSFSDGSLGEEEGAAVLRNAGAKLKMKDGKIALGNADLPLLPMVPPASGQLELLNLFDYLLDQLKQTTIVLPGAGAAAINPLFTASVTALQQNIKQLKGTL